MRAITIGNFDGVHAGHQALLAEARVRAGRTGEVVAVTLESHPASLLNPSHVPPSVQTLQERRDWLLKCGADRVHVLATTAELLAMDAAEFIAWLRKDLPFEFIVEGRDFRFGRGREGDLAALRAMGSRLGFEVAEVAAVEVCLGDSSVAAASSSLLRWLIQNGRVEDAAKVMARPYQLTGRVEQGDQRGRTLGWPTANVATQGQLLPGDGIYAGIATLPSGARRRAAISVGTKPTFGRAARTVEAFLLDHTAPLDDYGWTLTLEFSRWLREQSRFDGVEALLEQMNRDTQRTRLEIADELVLA
ncbi:MAG: riboflavin biosynthesis protein RibF [Planctomycetes bacterium]|nr:riboflavin biosynthesis protein RibF [Planctomycetota bacterium]